MENLMRRKNLSPLSLLLPLLEVSICLSRSEDTNLEDFIVALSITEDFYYHQLDLGNR